MVAALAKNLATSDENDELMRGNPVAAQSYTQTLENKMDKVGSLPNLSAPMIEW